MERERWIGLLASVAFHATILLGSSFWIAQKVQYGMAQGENSVAVDLVEGASKPEAKPEPLPQPEPVAKLAPEEMPQAVVPKPPLQKAVHKEPEKVPRKSHSLAAQGKGVSGAGQDAITLRRASGTSSAQPDYVRNPPPAYPEECRCRGEQGTVLVKVLVSPRGTAQSVALSRSSGFGPLDRAALDAVRRWRFRAATMGGMPVESYVMVPIRFVLEN
ncbi:TonB family protein [Verrucomicrobium sp. 3C]|uniref:TonB family protein n=1 Tax=Verrucomicrobium sp. 3C TaxID=1134055 RepID=UPI000368DA0A|nr:TonB family protein [Verrucomicrobium sp. 3C]